MQSDYDLLGVGHDVSDEDLKKAFHRLAHIHHPDKPGGNVKKMQELTAAYARLQKRPKTVIIKNHDFFAQYNQNIYMRFTNQGFYSHMNNSGWTFMGEDFNPTN